MALFLDSAFPDEARLAAEWGFVSGVTTNPALIARTGRPREEVVVELCRIVRGPVFVQLQGSTLEEYEADAQALRALSPSQIHLKVPCTLDGLRLVARVAPHIPCAATALFSPAQAWLAAQAGVRYVIPYVNRTTRLVGPEAGPELVRAIAGVLNGTPAQIIAASLKSPEEAAAAAQAGAQHLTVPLGVLRAMVEHPLTRQALDEFSRQP